MMKKKEKKIKEGLFVLPSSPSEKGYLIGSKCRDCKTVFFPKKVVCPICLKDDSMEEIPLSGVGKLYTYSINQVAPEGFEAPYILGQVDLPEKVRIFSVIAGCEPKEDSLHIGMDMEVIFEPLRKDEEGNDLISYKFRPVVKD